ncbi:TonB family protein [Rhodoplanes serenus]|uniref:TonB family protein n=1 Tax=Rhodoplanes serenus TaxID=200615 RepID=A0A9X4XQ38_9BRAD|nr:energy transducer TonB [Rhodoplanes serenus]MTW17564.1 TonB family protein [Rhodoplanes serenus]
MSGQHHRRVDRATLTVVPRRAVDAAAEGRAPAVVLRPFVEEARHRGNVVSLAPVRAGRNHAVGASAAPPLAALCVDDRVTPLRHPGAGRRSAAVAVASVLLHAAALAAFARVPPPAASIGVEVVSVELVLGADTAAGLAPVPGMSETVSAAASGEPAPETTERETAKPETPAPPPPDETVSAPAAAVAEPPVPEPAPAPAETTASAPPIEPEAPERVARPEPIPPKAETRTVEPPKAAPRKPAAASRKPVSAPRTGDTARDARPSGRTASVASSAASGVGIGRSDRHTNYRGLVAAHLARHKQFPSDARAAGLQGSTTVTFTIDGGGRVTAVRLGRASGIASLDQESVAMVRRASPFPAPPDGRAMSFTVPVGFHLR